MITTQLIRELYNITSRDRVRENEILSQHCSFRTGGPADLFIRVETAEELERTMELLSDADCGSFLLGRGTNLLIGDGGFRGAVVTMCAPAGEGSELCEVNADGCIVTAGAGAPLFKIATAAKDAGLAGLEFAAGIPGSLGGAVMMNAGAYDGEMKNVIRSVDVFYPDPGRGNPDRGDRPRVAKVEQGDRPRVPKWNGGTGPAAHAGSIVRYTSEEMEFGYRTSRIRREGGIVLSAQLELTPGDKDEISDRIADLAQRRREKQPLEFASAGSTFKRPEGYFAGKLIEDAGLKGFSVGDAQVSEKHAGFVINRGGASAAQIRALIEEVQRVVLENSGVRLEREVIFLGDF